MYYWLKAKKAQTDIPLSVVIGIIIAILLIYAMLSLVSKGELIGGELIKSFE